MKLYYYEHCPYCIRVLMITYFKNIALEHVVLANDDEATPLKMIGKKMLPILEKDSGDPLPESLDIISFLDNLTGPILDNDNTLNEDVQLIINDMSHSYSRLVLPRMPQPFFKEFETESARKYFTKKKEQMVGSFEDCLTQTENLITEIKPHLDRLSEKISTNENSLSYQDIHLFPRIYLLQLVKELTLPVKMKQYFDQKNKEMGNKFKLP